MTQATKADSLQASRRAGEPAHGITLLCCVAELGHTGSRRCHSWPERVPHTRRACGLGCQPAARQPDRKTRKETGARPNGGAPVRVSRGLSVNPRVYVAFSPPQVLADPVGWQSPFAPFVADGALRDSQDCGYIACRQHAVGASESTRLRAPPPNGHLVPSSLGRGQEALNAEYAQWSKAS